MAKASIDDDSTVKLAPWATGEGTLGANPLAAFDRLSLPTEPGCIWQKHLATSAGISKTSGDGQEALIGASSPGAKRRKLESMEAHGPSSLTAAVVIAGVQSSKTGTTRLGGEHTKSSAVDVSASASPIALHERVAARSREHVGKEFRCGPALRFSVDATSGMARATTLRMTHGVVPTPVFMPVGTQGTVKGVAPADLEDPALDCRIALGNTYHLGTRPGEGRMRRLGGLHRLMGLRAGRCLLTDSGGFQMVSLLHLAEITEKGVEFRSPMDGSKMLLTPERSMRIQNAIGADILMALDDVVDSKTVDGPRFKEACARTLRWIDRCIAAHARTDEQNLFGIVQGGLDTRPGGLRDDSLRGMMRRDACLPGYAIGGLAGGEDKRFFWRVVAQCCAALPPWKPRYLMGVGFPLDLVVCVGLGVDMFDCVFPTRTARFGCALVPGGQLRLRAGGARSRGGKEGKPGRVSKGGRGGNPGGGKEAAQAAPALAQSPSEDARPIDETCPCPACRRGREGFTSRARLHAMARGPDPASAAQLLTLHNVCYMLRLSRAMRRAVVGGAYPAFAEAFLREYYPAGEEVPLWAREALTAAGIAGPGREWLLAEAAKSVESGAAAGGGGGAGAGVKGAGGTSGPSGGEEEQFAAAIPSVGLSVRFEGSTLDWGLDGRGDRGLGWDEPSLQVPPT